MLKINTDQLAQESWSSPKGKFAGAGKNVSEALGRRPQSTDLNERHPFDVEIIRIGESVYYPDSGKWGVRSPERRLLRGDALNYYDGEE